MSPFSLLSVPYEKYYRSCLQYILSRTRHYFYCRLLLLIILNCIFKISRNAHRQFPDKLFCKFYIFHHVQTSNSVVSATRLIHSQKSKQNSFISRRLQRPLPQVYLIIPVLPNQIFFAAAKYIHLCFKFVIETRDAQV